jgi:hypothetical protein
MKDHYSVKGRIWCAVCWWRIFGLVFFSEIISEHYQDLVMNFISVLDVNKQNCWFPQDGAMAHTANSTVQMMSEFFVGHIASQNLQFS